MSGGEYSVFPILYEFVRQQIAYSIVLIDELDLNLHPPLAQFFVNQLPQISPTSQFIFTTHSEAVTEIIGNDEIYRIKGGRLCL
jgi:predicted ATP-binding protein involved in virulence